MITKKIEFRIAGRDAEYVGVDEETGRDKYQLRGVDIQIDKGAVIAKGSRKVDDDIFEWRLETGDGRTLSLSANQLGTILGNEKRHKAAMRAILKKQGGEILIQGMTGEDVRHFKKHDIEVDRNGWMTAEQALKAAKVAERKEMELCKCNFTKERLKNIKTFIVEVECASGLAKDMEQLISEVRKQRDGTEEILRGKNLS